MGGCCCSSRKAQLQGTPIYYYCPPPLEEQSAIQSYNRPATGLPTGIFVGLNLDTSTPDTYRPPPTPIPFNVLFGHPQSPLETTGNQEEKCQVPEQQPDVPIPVIDAASDGCFETTVSLDLETKKDRTSLADILLASPKKSDTENLKQNEHVKSGIDEVEPEEEECCPICLEEYDAENPKKDTDCEHHFHLSCILEWMERSDSCPVCDKEMIFDHLDE